MSRLLEIRQQIDRATEQISETERTLATFPKDRSLGLALASLEKHRRQLEDEFEVTSREVGIDVCRYRVFGQRTSSAADVFRSAIEFQDLYTLTYSALRTGPKKRKTVGIDDLEATSFGFSYSFAGSVGFVFTLPNDRLLFGETDLDSAMATVFSMAKLTEPAQIREYAERLGLAVIRELYLWSGLHADGGMGTDVDWRRGHSVRNSLLVQPQELADLRSAIESTSDEHSETLVFIGTLLGGDVQPKRFHLRLDSGEEIRGTFFDAISERHVVSIPQRCRATVTKKTVLQYATNEERISYFLEHIDELEQSGGEP